MFFRLPKKFPLLPRKRDADKSRFGHVLVVAGSRGMTGAAQLASRAALRSGAGLVTLAVPAGIRAEIAARHPSEIMYLPLPEAQEGAIAAGSFAEIKKYVQKRKVNSLVVGPGLSTHPGTAKLVRRLTRESAFPVLLDADGLNAFRGQVRLLKERKSALILTPHKNEFERLFSKKWLSRSMDRARLAKRLSRIYDGVLVLKGAGTLVVYRDRVYRNATGNPGMAKAGSGDVLSGVIAAFVAQGLSPFLAAAWGVYFHGLAGDIALKKSGELGLTASDVIDVLPKAFHRRAK